MEGTHAQLWIVEVPSCLRLVEISERGGPMPAEDAMERRKESRPWYAFLMLAADCSPRNAP